jgi:hypothetical protein
MFESCGGTGCAIRTHSAHSEVHAEALVTQGFECFQCILRGYFQILGSSLECTCQGAVPVATLAFKVGNGVHAGGHGLKAAHTIDIHPAKQQANLRKPVNESV